MTGSTLNNWYGRNVTIDEGHTPPTFWEWQEKTLQPLINWEYDKHRNPVRPLITSYNTLAYKLGCELAGDTLRVKYLDNTGGYCDVPLEGVTSGKLLDAIHQVVNQQ